MQSKKQNYPESKKILEEIKKAKRILLNCHKNPDPDSIGSSLAMYQVIKNMGKEVRVVCPTEISDMVSFLEYHEKVEEQDFSKIDFSKYDLFIALDSSSWDFASGLSADKLPEIPLVVIDHHKTNEKYGKVNLVDSSTSSCAEMVYKVLEDWGVNIDKEVATSLLTGIIGDTGAFKFPGTYAETLEVAGKLMVRGADKDKIIFHIFFSVDVKQFKFWGEILSKLELDGEHRLAWMAISNDIYKKYGGQKNLKESTATNFAQSIKGTDFGVVMVEVEKGELNVSLRSRTGLDVSKIAMELGGGGHQYAAGGGVKGLPFDEAVEKVLKACRKYAKKASK